MCTLIGNISLLDNLWCTGKVKTFSKTKSSMQCFWSNYSIIFYHQQEELESKVNQVKTNHAALVIQTKWKKHRGDADKKKEEERRFNVGRKFELCLLGLCLLLGGKSDHWQSKNFGSLCLLLLTRSGSSAIALVILFQNFQKRNGSGYKVCVIVN